MFEIKTPIKLSLIFLFSGKVFSELVNELEDLVSAFEVEDEQAEKDERRAHECEQLLVRVAATNASPGATRIPVMRGLYEFRVAFRMHSNSIKFPFW